MCLYHHDVYRKWYIFVSGVSLWLPCCLVVMAMFFLGHNDFPCSHHNIAYWIYFSTVAQLFPKTREPFFFQDEPPPTAFCTHTIYLSTSVKSFSRTLLQRYNSLTHLRNQEINLVLSQSLVSCLSFAICWERKKIFSWNRRQFTKPFHSYSVTTETQKKLCWHDILISS